ncbi:MAG TPA: hypothetical protein VGI33_00100 [Paenibacillus sp.]
MNAPQYEIKNPQSARTLISICFSMSLFLFLLLHNTADKHLILYSVEVLFLVFSFVTIVIIIMRMFEKPSKLQFASECLIVKGTTLEATAIKSILIQGYFKPVIGIKPSGKLLVPIRLCFRFNENEDQAILELKQWAERNQVKIYNKSFIRWM